MPAAGRGRRWGGCIRGMLAVIRGVSMGMGMGMGIITTIIIIRGVGVGAEIRRG